MAFRSIISPFRQKPRKPSDADWGLDVTIAIAALTNPDGVIVCVSDRMISYGDLYPADDNATIKAFRLNDQWDCAWAANRVAVIMPIIEEARKRFGAKTQWEGREAADTFAEIYSEMLHKEFVSEHLSRFNYKTMDQFRKEGRVDLGDNFAELCMELGRFELGADFLLFGHDHQKAGRLFRIESPGRVYDQNAIKFAVIGSGHDMAMASLRWPPPISFLLEDTIYRLLEAKFSAETATGVGKKTTVILRNPDGRVAMLSPSEIEEIRNIWKKEVADVPSPPAAIGLLENSLAVKKVAGER